MRVGVCRWCPAIMFVAVLASAASAFAAGSARAPKLRYDLLVRSERIYDGSGNAPFAGELAIAGDRIVYVGVKAPGAAVRTIDAGKAAVAPGFINMLSWSNESLLVDGRAESALRQGITLEVMGEGESMGPLTPDMKIDMKQRQEDDARYDVTWTTLDQYLRTLEGAGVAVNVASHVGAATLRGYVMGDTAAKADPAQIARMQELLRKAMEEGALGVASALIYTPGTYADTGELTALAAEAGRCGGIYATHLRSEGDRFLEALDEALAIARASGAPLHVYHLKVGGRANWPKMDAAIERIASARAAGLAVTADVYPYDASGTGLDAAMPPWVREGGVDAWVARLQDGDTARKVAAEMREPSSDWENVLAMAGADGAIVAGVKTAALQSLIGRRLSDIAAEWGVSPEAAAIRLVVEDKSRVAMVYRTMSEDNLRRLLQTPFVAFGTDAPAMVAEGAFLRNRQHPRAYGTFARVLGRYVRDEGLVPLEAAIHRMTGFPAQTLGLGDRGLLKPGYFADVVIFDADTIQDHATFTDPHRYASGVRHVVVNGVEAIREGQATNARAGKIVRGRGWKTPDGHGGCRASSQAWSHP